MTYHEPQQPIVTHRGKVEKKAPQHYSASSKSTSTTISTPLPPPDNTQSLIKELGDLFKTIKLTKNQDIISRWEGHLPLINQLIQRITTAPIPEDIQTLKNFIQHARTDIDSTKHERSEYIYEKKIKTKLSSFGTINPSEWDVVGFYSIDTERESTKSCGLCGHAIQNIYTIKKLTEPNKFTKLEIGSECVINYLNVPINKVDFDLKYNPDKQFVSKINELNSLITELTSKSNPDWGTRTHYEKRKELIDKYTKKFQEDKFLTDSQAKKIIEELEHATEDIKHIRAEIQSKRDVHDALKTLMESSVPFHSQNSFLKDIYTQWQNNHTLTERQIEAFKNTLSRYLSSPTQDEPEGEHEVEGIVSDIRTATIETSRGPRNKIIFTIGDIKDISIVEWIKGYKILLDIYEKYRDKEKLPHLHVKYITKGRYRNVIDNGIEISAPEQPSDIPKTNLSVFAPITPRKWQINCFDKWWNQKIGVVHAGTGSGKCIRGNVLLSNGILKNIKDIESGDEVLSLNDNLKIIKAMVNHKIESDVLNVFRVSTSSGRELEVSETHPLLTIDGWKPLSGISEGQFIGVPRQYPNLGNKHFDTNMLKILGYILANGSLTGSGVGFSSGKKEILDDLRSCLPYPCQLTQNIGDKQYGYHIVGVGRGSTSTNPVLDFLKKNGLKEIDTKNNGRGGCDSYEKYIPDFVFELDKKDIAVVLNRMFSCDGWIDSPQRKGGIGYCSVSKRMIYGMQHLLLRFGVLSRIRYRDVKYQNGTSHAYELMITKLPDMIKFQKYIGIFSKDKILEESILLKQSEQKTDIRTMDIIPVNINYLYKVFERNSRGNLKYKSDKPRYESLRNCRHDNIERHNLQKVIKWFDDNNLRNLAESDIYWDTIKSIIPIGKLPCWDLEIEDNHNFIAEDFFAHNTVLGLMAVKKLFHEKPIGTVIITVPTIELQRQWNSEVDKFGITQPVGLIGGDGGQDTFGQITIGIYNSLRNRDLKADILIADEAHHLSDEAQQNFTIWAQQHFERILFISATPGRIGKQVPIICKVSQDELQEEGSIVQYDVTNVPVELTGADYIEYNRLTNEAGRAGMMETNYGKKLLGERFRFISNHPLKVLSAVKLINSIRYERAIVFFTTTASVDYFYDIMVKEGVPVSKIHSKMHPDDRKEHLRAFSSGKTKILTGAFAISEGLNIPDADTVIIVGGTSVERQFIQRVGRVLRVARGKQSAQVYQIYCTGTMEEKWIKNRTLSVAKSTNIKTQKF